MGVGSRIRYGIGGDIVKVLLCVEPRFFHSSAPRELARQFKRVGAELNWILVGDAVLSNGYSIVDTQLLCPDDDESPISLGTVLYQNAGSMTDRVALAWKFFRLKSTDFDLVLYQGDAQLSYLLSIFGYNPIEMGGWTEGRYSPGSVLPTVMDPNLKRRNNGNRYTLVYLPGASVKETAMMLSHVEDRQFIIYTDEDVDRCSGRIEVRSFSHQAFRRDLCGASAFISQPDVNLVSECLYMGIPLMLELRSESQVSKAAVASLHEIGLVQSTRNLTPLLISLWLDSSPGFQRVRWPDVAQALAECAEGAVNMHDAVSQMTKSLWGSISLPTK